MGDVFAVRLPVLRTFVARGYGRTTKRLSQRGCGSRLIVSCQVLLAQGLVMMGVSFAVLLFGGFSVVATQVEPRFAEIGAIRGTFFRGGFGVDNRFVAATLWRFVISGWWVNVSAPRGS